LRAFDAGPCGDREGHDIRDAANYHEVSIALNRRSGDNCGADHADLTLTRHEILNDGSGPAHVHCLNV
jgi:hypothetical protein